MKRFFLPIIILILISINANAAKTGSIVVDADSGEVYHDLYADNVCYPASLTKMMTLYMLFDAIEKGKASLYHRMPVSAHAASQEPTKIHVRPGEKLLVKHAIEAIAVKSANDAAVVVGEYLYGTEAAFAQKMTQKAHELGMKNTYFKNASGLPNPMQRTTARDLAKLALALMHHFPQHYDFFGTKYFNYRGKNYRNHNRLLFSYPGCTGLKTGYIRASGFNLAATAERDNKRLIGIVMGEKSPAARGERMSRLLNSAFTKCGIKTKGASCTLAKPSQEFAVCALPNWTPQLKLASVRETPNFTRAVEIEDTPIQDTYLEVGTYKNYTAAEIMAKRALTLAKDIITKDNVKIDTCKIGESRYRIKIIDLAPKDAEDLTHIYTTNAIPCLKLQSMKIHTAAPAKKSRPVAVKKPKKQIQTKLRKIVKRAKVVPQRMTKPKRGKRRG